jgi:hypothetical protein
MRISFSWVPDISRFIVTASETFPNGAVHIHYAEEHDANETLLDITNKIRSELNFPPHKTKG